MPESGLEFDKTFEDFVTALNPSRVLDVGVGAGKIGQEVQRGSVGAHIEGIEIEESYADKFKKEWKVYSRVHIGDALKLSTRMSKSRWDLVVFGDVLEHLWLHEALSLVEFWSHRTEYLVAIWPNGYRQDALGGIKSEIHKCEIGLYNFFERGMDVVRFHRVRRLAPNQFKNFAVIRGCCADAASVQKGVVLT